MKGLAGVAVKEAIGVGKTEIRNSAEPIRAHRHQNLHWNGYFAVKTMAAYLLMCDRKGPEV